MKIFINLSSFLIDLYFEIKVEKLADAISK